MNILFKIFCIFSSVFIFVDSHHQDLIQKILDHHNKCTKCEIVWSRVPQDYLVPNNNARICRTFRDRAITGDLHLDGNRNPFCLVVYNNRAEKAYNFEILNINSKEIRVQSEGDVNSLPGDRKSNEHKEVCHSSKIKEILDILKYI